jgi:uncharacterized DUF497 family protein
VKFEWDERKARENVRKHGVTFEEAVTVFGDFDSITIEDDLHSTDEERWVVLGMSTYGTPARRSAHRAG